MKFLRKIIRGIGFGGGYYLAICSLFEVVPTSVSAIFGTVQPYILFLIGGAICSVFLTLLSIEFRKTKLYWLQLPIIVLLLLEGGVFHLTHEVSLENYIILLSLVLFHLGLLLLYKAKRRYFKEMASRSIWQMSYKGMATYGVLLGVILTLMIGRRVTNSPVECHDIYNSVQNLAITPIKPVQKAAQSFTAIANSSLGDLVSQRETGRLTVGGREVSIMSGNMLGGAIQSIKIDLVDEALEDKSLIRQSVCELIAEKIQNTVQKGFGSLSLYILLFFIVGPFVTLLFRFVAVLIRVIIHILKLCRVYRWKKRMRWINELV